MVERSGFPRSTSLPPFRSAVLNEKCGLIVCGWPGTDLIGRVVGVITVISRGLLSMKSGVSG